MEEAATRPGIWTLEDEIVPPYAPPSGRENEVQDPAKASCCCGRKTWYSLKSHPIWVRISRFIAMTMLGLMIWGSFFSELGAMAGPEGQLFRIGLLGVTAYVAGYLVSFLGLPVLLGMMLMGIALRNVGVVVITGPYLEVAAALRQVSLTIILIRAGLELDPVALKKLVGAVLRIVIIPAAAEAISIATMTYFLFGLPWIWGFLLGSALAALSPAVVIPCLFNLQEMGNYGKSKGIPTLVIAASGFDDILCISLFGILLSMIMTEGNVTTQIIQAPVGIAIGLASGVALGVVLRCIPQKNDERVAVLRTLLVFGGGILFVFGSAAIGYEAAGPLGCIIIAFVASNGWDSDGKHYVEESFRTLWEIFQPLLFGLIGTEINLFVLEGTTVGLGVVSLIAALVVRMVASILAAAGGKFNWKEKLFISIAWLPKATVQAALGPVALDRARELGLDQYIPYANTVLIICVLSILITAPMGGILITFLGPRLLKKEEPEPISSVSP